MYIKASLCNSLSMCRICGRYEKTSRGEVETRIQSVCFRCVMYYANYRAVVDEVEAEMKENERASSPNPPPPRRLSR